MGSCVCGVKRTECCDLAVGSSHISAVARMVGDREGLKMAAG